MSFIDDICFGSCLAALVQRLATKGPVDIIPAPTPLASEEILHFSRRVAEAAYSAVPEDRLFSRHVFFKVYSDIEEALAYWFGGSAVYIRRTPKESKLHDAQTLTVLQLMEKHGISRSYAFQLKKEARKRAQ